MSLNVSAWSIRSPLPAIIVSVIFVLLGAMSFGVLPITRLPSVDVPIVSIAIADFGAAPAELNDQVTKPVEDAVSGVEGVRHVISNITDGLSITTVAFQLEADPARALNDVKDAITRVRWRLPQNIGEPLIQRVAVVNLPTLTYAAASSGKTPEQLSYFVDDVVRRALQGLKGVGQVERIGGVEREVSVSLDPDRPASARPHRDRRQPAIAREQGRRRRRPGGDRRPATSRSARSPAAATPRLNRPRPPIAAVGRHRSPRRHRLGDRCRSPSRRPSPAVRRQSGGRLQCPARQGRERCHGGRLRGRARSRKSTSRHPDVDLKLIDSSGRFHFGQLRRGDPDPVRGRARSPSSSCWCSCATGGPR